MTDAESAVRLAVATELAEKYKCSVESALRSANRHLTSEALDIEACEQEVRAKRCGPCLVAIDIFGGQLNYTRRVDKEFYPVTEKSFPFFGPTYANTTASEALHVTWGDVQRQLNDDDSRRVRLVTTRTGDDVQSLTLEEQYTQVVLAEEFYDPVAFVSFMDGTLPLVDYIGARQAGVSAEVLDQQMRHSAGSAARLPEKLPVFTSGASRAPPRRRLVTTNSPITSVPSRQDKWNAQRLLAAHHLNHLRSVHAHTAIEAEIARVASGIMFPVVVKPVSGAGSEFVTVCRCAEDLTTAFAVAKGVRTSQSTDATHMTIEEYIEGPEYVVNVVTYAGVSVVTDVWRSFKYPMAVHSHRLRSSVVHKMEQRHNEDPSAPLPALVDTVTILYDRQEFVADLALLPEDHEARRVVDYTLKCVNALGMRNGASHCELRVDERVGSSRRGQPVLIELNPRVLGDVPRATHLVGYDQVTLLFYLAAVAAAFPEPPAGRNERRLTALPWPPVPTLYTSSTGAQRPSLGMSTPDQEHTIFIVFLTVADDGVLCGPGVKYVSALPTFVRIARGTLFDPLAPNFVCTVRRTTDLFSSPGACVFEGPRADVERDVAKLRLCEQTSYPEPLAAACSELICSRRRLDSERRSDAAVNSVKQALCGAAEGVTGRGDAPRANAAEIRLLRDALKAECLRIIRNQDPPPLYVPTALFDLMRQCELAGELHN